MKLNTKYFGEIEVQKDEIIRFPDGIPGFEDLKEFLFIENPDQEVPFHWLQSAKEEDIAFVVVNPFMFKKDYEFEIFDYTKKIIKIEDEKDLALFVIVVVPENINEMTANLMAPILINTKEKLAKQIVLEKSGYNTKHRIIDEIKKEG
ncbi:MAG: flagellar assembly protein FliW [Clostridiales bacterium]|nr:flagellar assembly protein FliW [Clostridiales bacterium]